MALQKYRFNGSVWYKGNCGFCNQEFKYRHGSKLRYCPNPSCDSNRNIYSDEISKMWMKPKTEVKLFILQEAYLNKIDLELFRQYSAEIKKDEEERDQSIIKKHENQMDKDILLAMYNLVHDYTGSLLKIRMKKDGFFLQNEDFIDKVLQATFYWYERFTSKYLKIDDSWAGFINYKITEALYKYSNDEMMDSTDKSVSDGKGGKEVKYLEVLNPNEHKFLWTKATYEPYVDHENVVESTGKMLSNITQHLIEGSVNKRDVYLSLIGFKFFINKDFKKLNNLYELFGNRVKEGVEMYKMIIRKYLREFLIS